MFKELINAFFFIFMAEMGDKTQILAMAFATKYPLRKVLLGVALGSFLNHGLAVLIGTYLTHFIAIPLDKIRLIAAVAFVGFGLWTLNIEKNEDEEETQYKYGGVLTVATAFFVGELGDKTQLTAITLSTKAIYPVFLLMGTVLGMVFTSAMGVFVGSKLGKKIPEVTLKLISATIFIGFGILSLWETVPRQYLTPIYISIFFFVLGGIIFYRLMSIFKGSILEDTPLKKVAGELYINTQQIQQELQTVCTLEDHCKACREGKCTIQSLQEHLEEANRTKTFVSEEEWKIPLCKKHLYDRIKLRKSLVETLNTCHECSIHQKNCVGNQTRIILEKLLYGKIIPFEGNRNKYFQEINKIDPNFFNDLEKE